MTYFGFLAIFLVIPLVVLGWLTWRDRQRNVNLPSALQNWPAWVTLAGHVVVDTAGRLHIDQTLMDEVRGLKQELAPTEILFVADAMTGQDAVRSAGEFHEALDTTGVVLTKMDGDARGGAALSIRHVTGVPIKFIGIGETPDAFERFHPDRMVGRILGMGDVLSLIEKAEEVVDEDQAKALEKKLRKNEFSLADFHRRIKSSAYLWNAMGKIGVE